MIVQGGWQEVFSFAGQERVVLEASEAQLTPHAGLLPLRALDEHLGLTQAFGAVLDDRRDPEAQEHTVTEMVRARVYGILAGHEDQNDHTTLRTDPIFKLLVGRSPADRALASQPTLSRFENSINIASLKRLRDLFIDQFIASFSHPPRHLVLDLDAVDDPAHGNQQLTFWHNYYDQNQYLPLVLTCANNDLVVMLSLRHGSCHAALGAPDDLEYLVNRLRQVWPDVVLYVRGDAAFGIPSMYEVSERLRLFYTFGLASNAVLNRQTESLFEQALVAWQQERQRAAVEGRRAQPVRLFEGFWYQAESWASPRWVIVKAEVNEQGSQRRFVVTNRPGALLLPEPTYDEYGMRGESENRNKELKCGCYMDRLSDHRFVANYFRLYLHGAALNLLVRMRQAVQIPEAATVAAAAVTPTEVAAAEPVAAAAGAAVEVAAAEPVPAEAFVGEQRRRYFRRRQQQDVLGRAQPDTWRRLVIGVAAEVVVSVRRVVVRLSGCWPHLEAFQQMCARLRTYLHNAAPAPT